MIAAHGDAPTWHPALLPQEEPRFAEVAVALPNDRAGGLFHYRVPDGVRLVLGQLVVVPLGSRRTHGVVVGLAAATHLSETRPIESVVDARPVLTPLQIELARWMAQRYLTPLGKVLAAMIPPGLRSSFDVELSLRPRVADARPLRIRERRVVEYLAERGPTRLRLLRSRLGLGDATRVAASLARKGIVARAPVVVGPRTRRARQRAVLTEAGRSALGNSAVLARAPRQAEALAFLNAQADGACAIEHLRAETGADGATLRALVAHGWVRLDEASAAPRAVELPARFDGPPRPTKAQSAAIERLVQALDEHRHRAFLLHGVTASGKTEVYLRLIAAVVERGKRALVLVPEIALTPQALHRYGLRFPGRVVAIHSRLAPRERIEAWRAIRQGHVDVVVGSRSALFSPIEGLGAIVVDEEHEPSFKQEAPPRYHARETAVALARLAGVPVVLGSATPDLVTYERAWRGELELLELPERVAGPARSGRSPPLPRVEVVDMRQAAAGGASGLFSPRLVELLGETLRRREQAILFLNRRGAATIVICAACGYVPRCKRCDVALVYHAASDDMVCHQCDRRTKPPELCPVCGSVRLSYFGAGTQRVALELQRLFPTARVMRWDRDAMTERHTAEELTRRFAAGEADVLVGTQAIAKGLDLPGVTLVGIISADTILHLPDLRAAERTFQLLTQVAGRAGRGPAGGRVVLQTFTPEHPCIRAAARHDYAAFARAELRFRREHGYPPFAELGRAIFSSRAEASARAAAARQAAALRSTMARLGLAGTSVVGPAPCYYRRVRGRYRWQILVRGREVLAALQAVSWPPGWVVDVDPVSLL